MTRDSWAERTWRPFGRSDPYYGVCSHEMFRSHRMDAATRQAFFASGEEHVEQVLRTIREAVAPDFEPRSVLDFGSGVGRLLIPFSRTAERAVGVDISPEMIEEAQKNCAAAGLEHVKFVLSDDRLSRVEGQFDLVHSHIVLQHIPPARGERIFSALIDRIAPGGVGALQVTYARTAPVIRKVVHGMRRTLPLVNGLVNKAQGRPFSEPLIPMYEYDLHRLFATLQARRCDRVHVSLTDHGGHMGAMLVFRVPAPTA